MCQNPVLCVLDLQGSHKGLPAKLCSPLMASANSLLQIVARDLGPALAWVEEHQTQLAASTSSPSGQDFEFQLHRLQFVQLLTTKGVVSEPCTLHVGDNVR